MFIGSRDSYCERVDFIPTDISKLTLWASQNSKYKASIGNVINYSNVIDMYYYGEAGGVLIGLVGKPDYQETFRVDLRKNVEILFRNNAKCPVYNFESLQPFKKEAALYHIEVDMRAHSILVEIDDVPVIYADSHNSGVRFYRNNFLFDHVDFSFFKDWTSRAGEFIIYNKKLTVVEAMTVEKYLKTKWSLKYEREKDIT